MIVGAQKAGTTSLLRYLGEHPDCISHPQKEFAYFLNDTDYNSKYQLAFEKYYSKQNVNSNSTLIAKSATLYTSEIAIQRLYEHNPKCEIVLILRNPIDRTYSSYLLEKNAGSIHYEFDKIPDLLSTKSGWEYQLFIDLSIYVNHLKMIYKYFPANQVSVFLFEDLQNDTITVCQKIFGKLGLDTGFTPEIAIKHNPTKINRSFSYARTLNKILSSEGRFRKFVSHILPSYSFYRFGNFVRELNKTTSSYAPMNPQTRMTLGDFFQPYNKQLSELLGRDLAQWNVTEAGLNKGRIKAAIEYKFLQIEACNMCGQLTNDHIILGKRLNHSQGKNPKNKTGITTTVMQCKNCGLIYCNPLPVPFNIQDHYGVPPESYWQSAYFEVNPDSFKGEITKLKTLLPPERWGRALDIGAGLGKTMTALTSSGFETYGIEPSVPFYERSISQMKIDPTHLKLGMLEEASYPDNYFDFITFGAVLEHLYSPSDSIEKALKWLKPGGIIQIEVPSSDWLIHKIVNFYYKRFRFSDYVANLSPMHPPYHLYEFSLNSFLKHSKLNNYEVVSHEFYVCETYLPKALDYILKARMKRKGSGMQLCVWLKKR